MDKNMLWRGGVMLGTGLLMGSLFSFQSKSVSDANAIYSRESRVNIFKEIQVVKKSNENLQDQIKELEKSLAEGNTKEAVLNSIKADISKYQILSAELPAKGKGISIEIGGELEAMWFTDLENELLSAGAEAISIDGIRVTPENMGFDTIPNGQILLGGDILSSPYHFEAIGDPKLLSGSINQTGGILSRIQSYKPEYEIKVKEELELVLPARKQGK